MTPGSPVSATATLLQEGCFADDNGNILKWSILNIFPQWNFTEAKKMHQSQLALLDFQFKFHFPAVRGFKLS